MKQRMRIIIGIGILVALVLLVVGVDALRRMTATMPAAVLPASVQESGAPAVTLTPGSIPIYLDGQLVAGFSPEKLEQLKKVSFIEPVEGKTEAGWLLRDVLTLYLQPGQLQADTQVTISSSSRKKSAQLTWAEIDAAENMVLFDLSNRGTLKLASKLEKLDARDEWVQDVDKIEVAHQQADNP